MCSNKISKKILYHALSARNTQKFGRSQKFFFRGYLSNSGGMPNMSSLSDWVVSFLPYQFCTTIYYQRHKWYIVQDYSNFNPLKLYVTSDSEKGGRVRESGGRIGRLDAANEAGMFHKIDKAKMAKIKKTLKEKGDQPSKEPTADPANPSDK